MAMGYGIYGSFIWFYDKYGYFVDILWIFFGGFF